MENNTVTFKRTSLGQFESFLNGQITNWHICNGSLGASGGGANIYLVYDSTREDCQPTKIQGTLQMCKKVVTLMIQRKATREQKEMREGILRAEQLAKRHVDALVEKFNASALLQNCADAWLWAR